MRAGRSIATIFAAYSVFVGLVLYRIVPHDCRTSWDGWVVQIVATLPFLTVVAVNYLVVSLGAASIVRRGSVLVGAFAWIAFAMVCAAIAVQIGGGLVLGAAAASGYSKELLQQCIPRMTTDFLNATGGWLYWAATVLLWCVGAVAALRASRRSPDVSG